jgi:hypothetical protein
MDLFINKNFNQNQSNACSSVSIHFAEGQTAFPNKTASNIEPMSTQTSSLPFVDPVDNLFLKCVQLNDEKNSEKNWEYGVDNDNCSPLNSFEQQSSESSAESVIDFNILNEFMNVQDLDNQQSMQYDHASSTQQHSPDSFDSNKPMYENFYGLHEDESGKLITQTQTSHL